MKKKHQKIEKKEKGFSKLGGKWWNVFNNLIGRTFTWTLCGQSCYRKWYLNVDNFCILGNKRKKNHVASVLGIQWGQYSSIAPWWRAAASTRSHPGPFWPPGTPPRVTLVQFRHKKIGGIWFRSVGFMKRSQTSEFRKPSRDILSLGMKQDANSSLRPS